MEDLMNIQMTPQEYEEYRDYQKLKGDMKNVLEMKEHMIASLRDQYHQEFVERQKQSKRAIIAEAKLLKLKEISGFHMPINQKLGLMISELENDDE